MVPQNKPGNKGKSKNIQSKEVQILMSDGSEQTPHPTDQRAYHSIATILNTETKEEGEGIVLIDKDRNFMRSDVFAKQADKQIGEDIQEKSDEINIKVPQVDEKELKQKETSVFEGKLIKKQTQISAKQKLIEKKGMFFQRAQNIKKFIYQLKSKTNQFWVNLVSEYSFSLINDHSSDFHVFKHQRASKLMGKKVHPIHKYIMRGLSYGSKFMESTFGVFHPEDKSILIWEILFSIYLLSQIIIQPLRDSFPDAFSNQSNSSIFFIHERILPIILFGVDNMILFNTAVFKKGQLSKKRQDIIKKNLKKKFVWEVGIISFYYVGALSEEYYVFQYAILLKMFDFFPMIQKFCDIYDHNRDKLIYTSSAQIVAQIIILAHISASIFITVAKASAPDITWIDKLKEVTQIKNPTMDQLYISALYWSIITMVTLGYGDIVPISQREKGFVICVAFVSCALFSYSFNLIGEIINQSRKNKDKLKNDLEMLNNLMEDRGLNHELKSKVRRYFAYLSKENLQNYEIGQQMISNLPPALKDEVMFDLYSKLLKKVPLFSENFSDQFISELSLFIKEFKTGPELIIQKKKTLQDRLYFLLKGEVMLYWDQKKSSGSNIQLLQKGSIVGLQEFITQAPVEYFSKSESVSSISYLTYEQFIELLEKYPKDKEVYYKIKDKINNYRQGKFYDVVCPFCKKNQHPPELCPLIRYQPNQDKLFIQYKKDQLVIQDKRRKDHQRSRGFKKNSLGLFQNVAESGAKFNLIETDLASHNPNQENFEDPNEKLVTPNPMIDMSNLENNNDKEQFIHSKNKLEQEKINSSSFLPNSDLQKFGEIKKKAESFSQYGINQPNNHQRKILFIQPHVSTPSEDIGIGDDLAVSKQKNLKIQKFLKNDASLLISPKIHHQQIEQENSQPLISQMSFKQTETLMFKIKNKLENSILKDQIDSNANFRKLIRSPTIDDLTQINQQPPSPTLSQTQVNQNQNDKFSFMKINNFEILFNFLYYFPHNNLKLILKQMEEKRMHNLVDKKKKNKQQKKGYQNRGSLVKINN